MEQLEAIAERLEKAAEQTSSLAADTRLKFDVMVEMQSNERLEMQDRFAQEKKDLLDHFSESDKRKNKIIIGLIVTILLIIGSIVGGAIYICTNFDFAVATYQDVQADNGSNATIYDGIEYNRQ